MFHLTLLFQSERWPFFGGLNVVGERVHCGLGRWLFITCMISTFRLLLLITFVRIIIVLLLTALVLVVSIRSDVFIIFLTFFFVALSLAVVIFNTWAAFILLRITLVGLPICEKLLLEIEYPWMLENLYQWDSLLRDLHEELVDQVFVLLWELLLELDFLTDLISSNRRLIASEWCITMDQLIQKDA